MKSQLQIAGHPLHPMVVAFPIGLYTTAVVCDVVYLLLRDPFWFRMAYWAIVFGLLMHVVAALTGLPDFLMLMRERPDRPGIKEAQRAGSTHLVFGVGLLVVQGLNLAVRHSGEPSGTSVAMPLIVNLIGLALVRVQGWYGGELEYRHFIGIDAPVGRS